MQIDYKSTSNSDPRAPLRWGFITILTVLLLFTLHHTACSQDTTYPSLPSHYWDGCKRQPTDSFPSFILVDTAKHEMTQTYGYFYRNKIRKVIVLVRIKERPSPMLKTLYTDDYVHYYKDRNLTKLLSFQKYYTLLTVFTEGWDGGQWIHLTIDKPH